MASDSYKNKESFTPYDIKSYKLNMFNKDLQSTPSPYTGIKKKYVTAR